MRRNDLRKSLKKIKNSIDGNLDTTEKSETNHKDETATPFCTCRDKDGNPKNLYITHMDAKREVAHRHKLSTTRLETYPCPDGFGWHLTKR